MIWLLSNMLMTSYLMRGVYYQTLAFFMSCLLMSLPLDSWAKFSRDTCSSLELIPSSGSMLSCELKLQLRNRKQHPTTQSISPIQPVSSFANQTRTSGEVGTLRHMLIIFTVLAILIDCYDLKKKALPDEL